MKTPREILLEKHREADRRLAEIQAQVIGSLARPKEKVQPWPALVLQKLWDELVYPLRFAWGGLAAVWLVLAIANLKMNDPKPVAMAKAETASWLMAWKERQQIMDSTFAAAQMPVDRPRSMRPKPQSRCVSFTAIG